MAKKKPPTEGFFPGTDTPAGRRQWKKFTKFLDETGLTITITTTETKKGPKK